MVYTELTPLGSITLWIQIVGLPGPSDNVAHTFHDGYNLYGLDVEVVLYNVSVVYLSYGVLTQSSGWYVKWTTSVVC